MASVDFYFDYLSPYAYLAAREIMNPNTGRPDLEKMLLKIPGAPLLVGKQ